MEPRAASEDKHDLTWAPLWNELETSDEEDGEEEETEVKEVKEEQEEKEEKEENTEKVVFLLLQMRFSDFRTVT